jgi:phosphate transport system substrate-binding protein
MKYVSRRDAYRALCVIGFLLVATSVAFAEDEFNQITLGDSSLSLRADRVLRDQRGTKSIYLPSLPSDPVVLSPLLAQAIAAKGGNTSEGSTHVAIHGSNTIGAVLMGNLIQAYANSKEADTVLSETATDEFKIDIMRRGSNTPSATVELFAHGSATGFVDLVAHKADIGMSSRGIKPDEIEQGRKAQLGDLKAEGERFLGLDGVIVFVNRLNPISALSIDKIAGIFSGDIRDWSQVDNLNQIRGPIRVYARDDKSGTFDTFKTLVLDPAKKTLSATERFEDSDKLVEKVASDEKAIGFVGFAYAEREGVKKLALVADCGLPTKATEFSIKTEEYPLARRLYLYTPTPQNNRLAQDILDFVKGSLDTQRVIKESGFVNSDIAFEPFDMQAQRVAQLAFLPNQNNQDNKGFIEAVRFAQRASLTFHFAANTDELDAKARDDVRLLAKQLTSPTFGDRRFLIIGFASDKEGNRDAAKRLSEARARRVAVALRDQGAKNVYQDTALGYGNAAPVSCNNDQNQRVEVWLQN